ncbi:MAG: hypothetical protein ABIO70_07385 [Pseudomonadota bacterium]
MNGPDLDLDLLIARLDGGALRSLADLATDHVLASTVGELLPAAVVARHVAAGVRAAAARPDLGAWAQARLGELVEASIAPGPDGRRYPRGDTLRAHVPAELTDPVERLLGEPYLPDRALVLRLLDHEAMRSLISEVLQAALVRFARKMRSMGPDTAMLKAGLGRAARMPPGLSRLRSLGSGVVSAVGSELEHQLEQRVSEHVSQAISAALGQVATLLTAPERAATMGDWRAYGLRVVLDTELEAFAVEARKLDPARAARALTEGLVALARREGLEEELTQLLDGVLAPWRERTLKELVEEAGIEEAWREAWWALVEAQAGPVIHSAAFRAWLAAWLGSASTTG